MLIRVSASDIRYGVLMDCRKCAVARAMNRATRRQWTVTSGYCYAADRMGREVALSAFVTDRIKRIDAGERVEPFEFELAV